MTTRGRLLVVITHPMTADLLMRGQLRYLGEQGWHVGVAAAAGPELDNVARREACVVYPVPLVREIALLADLRALFRLGRVMREFRPDIVSAGTPKAGLLGTLAAWLAGIPHRVYVVRGLRLETARGWQRRVLTATERLAARTATTIVCVSASLRIRFLELAPTAEVIVLGDGSSNGVDTSRFAPGSVASDLVPLAPGAPVIGFVGRLTGDKGIGDLVAAFESIRLAVPGVALLLVGDYAQGDPVAPEVRRRIADSTDIHVTGFVDDSAPYYRRMSVLAFPSLREGMPNAPLEAAASAVPAVGYRVTGTADAIIDGHTGTLVDAGDIGALADALRRYLKTPDLALEHGRNARQRVLTTFQAHTVWKRWADLYASLRP